VVRRAGDVARGVGRWQGVVEGGGEGGRWPGGGWGKGVVGGYGAWGRRAGGGERGGGKERTVVKVAV
jgi:hypothetical protein